MMNKLYALPANLNTLNILYAKAVTFQKCVKFEKVGIELHAAQRPACATGNALTEYLKTRSAGKKCSHDSHAQCCLTIMT